MHEPQSARPHEGLPEPLHHLSEGLPLERPVGDTARVIVAIAEYPRFADGADLRKGCREEIAQAPTAPQAILIERFESQRIERA